MPTPPPLIRKIVKPLKSSALHIHVGRPPKAQPYPCGYYGDPKRQCRCSSRQIENYRQRISGPLLDRIDLHVEVPLVDFRELSASAPCGEDSPAIRERVVAARRIQQERFRKAAHHTNAAMNARQTHDACQLSVISYQLSVIGYLMGALASVGV